MVDKKDKAKTCCTQPGEVLECCQVEAVVSVDERGQMVLPKEIREKAGIKAGDKVAIISLKKQGNVSCLLLFKTETVADMVKGMLGPLIDEIIKK